MKPFRVMMLLCILLLGLSVKTFAQELPEVTVVSLNYKYIKSVFDTTAAQPVKLLQRRAASYNIKNSDFYEDEYDDFFVSFYIPQGQLLATYDKEGKLLRTAERYKNVALPTEIRRAVANRFPDWRIAKDVYLVNYYGESSDVVSKKMYKLLLENGDERMRTKIDSEGVFIK